MDRSGLRTWIEIDRKKIEHNYKVFRSIISGGTKLCGVVKSNAYGHGFFEYAKELSSLGIDYFAVDSVVEGIRLRKEGITEPILILGYTLPERMQEAVDNDLSITISNIDSLEAVKKIKGAKVHVKIDTGMSRQGFLEDQQEELFKLLNGINVEGVFTHFASAKNPSFPTDTKKQFERFLKWKEFFIKKGYSPIFHASATSGTLLFPETHLDMVRIGIGLYGLWPSVECKNALEDKINLKPVLSWKTIVSEIKEVEAGNRVGYDFTERLDKGSKLALCPIGYWHGYPRRLSSIGRVEIGGQLCRVIGRVSMDIIIVDVTGVNIEVLDKVTLIGDKFSVYDMARLEDTSWYETITRINPLIRRIFI
ncbi:MAG: alanine racemase [Candidatus Pacebacteria bacterium]|nr:alanine racemase [Candidatus Paceibacterota bacterium]